jgi:signal transduction histidine kinase
MKQISEPQPAAPHSDLLDERQRRGALVLRTLPILLIPVLASALSILWLWLTPTQPQFLPQTQDSHTQPNPLPPIVTLVVFFSALIVLVRLGRPRVSALLLIGVWTLMTTLFSLRAGVSSVVPALLIAPICAAGLLIDWAACVSLAALASLLIASMAWLEMSGLSAPAPTPPAFVLANAPILASGLWIGVFWTIAALTSLLAGGLKRALAQSRAKAAELRELSEQLEARVAEQTARLLEQERAAAMLEERARLARDIHDTLAQGLTGIVVQLGAAQRALGAASPDAPAHIDLAQRMARESLAEARRSVWNLRAPALDRGDLADALRALAARPLRPGTEAAFELRGAPAPLPPDAEGALLRVCQEALVNVARHAQASQAQVLLEYLPGRVRLSIRDNGQGFGPHALDPHGPAPGPWGGFGLLGMRERIATLGGTLALTNDGGALVVAELRIEN